MDWLRKHLIKIGIALVATGFLYDVFFAGIPHQDPTEELFLKYDRNETIAMYLMQFGLVVLVIGALLRVLMRKKKRLY